MNSLLAQSLIVEQVGILGLSILAILGAVITIGVAMLVFKFGWGSLKSVSNGGSIWDDDIMNTDPDYDDNMDAEDGTRVSIRRHNKYGMQEWGGTKWISARKEFQD